MPDTISTTMPAVLQEYYRILTAGAEAFGDGQSLRPLLSRHLDFTGSLAGHRPDATDGFLHGVAGFIATVRNIDIIRLLFGHKSYTMTLKYIGRNPYLVRTVATAIEQNYAAEFADLITAIQTGTSSGPGAERLLERINANKGAFEGRHLRLTILTYVSHLLSSGQPLFIHRTAVGSFCVSTQTYSSPNLPPCLVHRKGNVQGLPPNPSSCDPSCEHAVIVQKAQRAMEDNIKFYTNILEKGGNSLSDKSRKAILEKISSNTNHLNKLSQQAELIPALEVHV